MLQWIIFGLLMTLSCFPATLLVYEELISLLGDIPISDQYSFSHSLLEEIQIHLG